MRNGTWIIFMLALAALSAELTGFAWWQGILFMIPCLIISETISAGIERVIGRLPRTGGGSAPPPAPKR